MTYISERHRIISNEIGEPEVLTNPEYYFGPNYRTLLNFWIYWESLTSERRNKYLDMAFQKGTHQNLVDYARHLVGMQHRYFFYNELEILVAHKILEFGGSLVFLSLLENL